MRSRLAREKLMESAQKLFAKVYEQAQGAQQAGQSAGPGPDMNAQEQAADQF